MTDKFFFFETTDHVSFAIKIRIKQLQNVCITEAPQNRQRDQLQHTCNTAYTCNWSLVCLVYASISGVSTRGGGVGRVPQISSRGGSHAQVPHFIDTQ